MDVWLSDGCEGGEGFQERLGLCPLPPSLPAASPRMAEGTRRWVAATPGCAAAREPRDSLQALAGV